MSDRPTKTLVLPSTKEVEIKAYITARERNSFRDELYRQMRIDGDLSSGSMQFKEVTAEVFIKIEQKTLEMVLVAYDGSTENCLERLLDGTPEDYDFLTKEVNKITGGNFNVAK